jgi:CTD kinase subunit alpha
MPPPTAVPTISTVPRTPSGISSSNFSSTDLCIDAPVSKGHRSSPAKNAGFRPIVQASSAVKRFFPGEDDEEEVSVRHRTPMPADNRARFVLAADAHRVLMNKINPPHPRDPLNLKTRGKSHRDLPIEDFNGESERHSDNYNTRYEIASPSQHSSGPEHPSGLEKDNCVEERDEAVTSSANTPAHIADASSAIGSSEGIRGELYAIISQVGEGTFGKVYKARNTVTKMHVALKRIRMATEKDGFPVTAMREIKLLQSLRHDNIVRLYEMMVSNGELCNSFN